MAPVSCTVAFVLAALAVINPRFTPANLVRDSARILLLKVSAPQDKRVAAEVVETLRGPAFAEKKLKLDFGEAKELDEDDVGAAFGRNKTATAILFLAKPGDQGDDAPAGALLIHTQWFAVHVGEGKWALDRDKQDLFAIWAGSARMLAAATRYVLANPGADFPVRSRIHWGSDAHLGKLKGEAGILPASAIAGGTPAPPVLKGRSGACFAADLGAPIGPCAIVLSDAGDRVYQAARQGGKPADVTEILKLTTASRLAALGDFHGDGRLDIASWNGKVLLLATQGEGGVFGPQAAIAELPDCRSLAAVDVGAKGGAGLLAGTPAGPVLLIPDGQGRFSPHALPSVGAAGSLGPGGLCVAADFDRDGRCDILQVFEKGIVFYRGEAPGRFKEPAKTPISLVKNPCVAVCGDYDADGHLDVVVGGEDGLALLSRGEDGRWENETPVTGELAYHGNANQPAIVGGAPCDINGDGRQGVALFYPKRNPLVFFNRGFACFGLARELELSGAANPIENPAEPPEPPAAAKLKAAEALQQGQTAGTILDLNGDAIQDLLAVDARGDVWVLFGRAEREEALALTVALPPRAAGPVTVSLSQGRRRIGMHVVAPGAPAFIGCPRPGELLLEWSGADGTRHTRSVSVDEPTRVELSPE